MIVEKSQQLIDEISKVLIGKREIIEKVLMAVYANGHILLEDYPGTGKTTLALGFSKVMDLDYKRVQFTPDTMPSDITGFSIYNKATNEFEYRPGAVNCNLFLGDEINRTSPKTQSALLETMEEGNVTVDGILHRLPKPFICIATQNPAGSAGTQKLPDSQLDRFMVRLSIGYPKTEDQINILQEHQQSNPMDLVKTVMSRDEALEIQNYLGSIKMTKEILEYITLLCEETRKEPLVELGISPRGILALSRMVRARAILKERDYVIPEDVQEVYIDVCAHRLILRPQAKIEGINEIDILKGILGKIKPPSLGKR